MIPLSYLHSALELGTHLRWMMRRDYPGVLAIEELSFALPWTEENFLYCLRQRACIGLIAEQKEKVIGFIVYELHKAKLHVLNFAVSPTYRRLGVGTQMVEKLIGKLSSHRRTRITLAVRETSFARRDIRAGSASP